MCVFFLAQRRPMFPQSLHEKTFQPLTQGPLNLFKPKDHHLQFSTVPSSMALIHKQLHPRPHRATSQKSGSMAFDIILAHSHFLPSCMYLVSPFPVSTVCRKLLYRGLVSIREKLKSLVIEKTNFTDNVMLPVTWFFLFSYQCF